VGVKGGAVGSVIIQLPEGELEKIGDIFGVSVRASQAIIKDLTYSPQGTYWDPFWQPLFRLKDNTFLISPSLVVGSSPERNLVALLNRIPAKRHLYQQVSNQKETAQLREIEHLFIQDQFAVRRRVPVPRPDGSTLSDIDLLLFDRSEKVLLLVQAKWLARPDYWGEVFSRDEELKRAIDTLKATKARVAELGCRWLSDVFGTRHEQLPKTFALVVNRDFLPSGWVYDSDVPVVDMVFLRESALSPNIRGLASLYAEASRLDETLSSRLALRHGYGQVIAGDYIFEPPTIYTI
jgi:hypothetical protein